MTRRWRLSPSSRPRAGSFFPRPASASLSAGRHPAAFSCFADRIPPVPARCRGPFFRFTLVHGAVGYRGRRSGCRFGRNPVQVLGQHGLRRSPIVLVVPLADLLADAFENLLKIGRALYIPEVRIVLDVLDIVESGLDRMEK